MELTVQRFKNSRVSGRSVPCINEPFSIKDDGSVKDKYMYGKQTGAVVKDKYMYGKQTEAMVKDKYVYGKQTEAVVKDKYVYGK
jgi:hypothetical protein